MHLNKPTLSCMVVVKPFPFCAWKPVAEKIRFVLVTDGAERFILMCSHLTLSAPDIIRAYSYRFKIEVTFKMLKHLMGAFYYRFCTSAWPRIGKQKASDLSQISDARRQRLIQQSTDGIEAFANLIALPRAFSKSFL